MRKKVGKNYFICNFNQIHTKSELFCAEILSFMEICEVLFVQSCWQANQQTQPPLVGVMIYAFGPLLTPQSLLTIGRTQTHTFTLHAKSQPPVGWKLWLPIRICGPAYSDL